MKSPPLFEKELSGDFYSTPIYPPSSNSSPSVALICLAGRQPGKLRAIRYRNYLFVLMNRASFELSLSLSLSSNFSWKYEDPMESLQFYNFLEGFEDCEKDSKV